MTMQVDAGALADAAVDIRGAAAEWAAARATPWWVGDCGSSSVAAEITSLNDWYRMTWDQLGNGVTELANAAEAAASAYELTDEVVASTLSSTEYVI